jgi:plasmid stability protein
VVEKLLATLNIKNLPDSLYERMRVRARRERRSIAQGAMHLLATARESPEVLSILELRGLGKEIWHGVEPAGHVESERSSWDWPTISDRATSASTLPSY